MFIAFAIFLYAAIYLARILSLHARVPLLADKPPFPMKETRLRSALLQIHLRQLRLQSLVLGAKLF